MSQKTDERSVAHGAAGCAVSEFKVAHRDPVNGCVTQDTGDTTGRNKTGRAARSRLQPGFAFGPVRGAMVTQAATVVEVDPPGRGQLDRIGIMLRGTGGTPFASAANVITLPWPRERGHGTRRGK